MSNFKRKHPIPVEGDVVEITAKKVSDRVQPLFKVGKRFIVKRVMRPDDKPTLVVIHPLRKRATLAMSSERYAWKILRTDYAEDETEAKVVRIKQAIPMDKQKQYTYVPLLLQGIVLHYADACLKYAVEHRLDAMKKVSRALRKVIEAWDEDMSRGGRNVHLVARNVANDFIEMHQWHFVTLYNVLNQEYKRLKPDYEHIELITNALAGRLMVGLLVALENKYANIVGEAIGMECEFKKLRGRDEMEACFMCYANAPKGFGWNGKSIGLNLTIIRQRLEAFDFSAYDDSGK